MSKKTGEVHQVTVLEVERREAGLTQAALADMLHIGQHIIGKIENSQPVNPRFNDVKAMEDFFNLELSVLCRVMPLAHRYENVPCREIGETDV
jgi:predicted transcriptional regulator